MRIQVKANWRAYIIEAWALGMFMISASSFVILFEHPAFKLNSLIPSAIVRRFCIGLAMGLTAVLLIYSKWGKQSGAHMNPAVTLANYRLKRISTGDALGYILFQLIGGSVAMLVLKFFFQKYLSHPSVNFVQTQPGSQGITVAAAAEFLMSFLMFLMVMIVSNSRLMKYTGYFAGALVCVYITLEAPLSGMSINPARSFASAIAAGNWTSFWIYLLCPIAGMQLSAILCRLFYLSKYGECKSMKCLMSGHQFTNRVYHVYSWVQTTEKGGTVKVYEPKSQSHPVKIISIQR